MRAAGLALVVVLGACTPEIGAGTYFCGPEMFCAPDLACNPTTFTCETPASFAAFTCPTNAEASEPDDDLATASSLGPLTCGVAPAADPGCIATGDDVDTIRFDFEPTCQGEDPHVAVTLQFPVATVPLELSLVDDSGAVLATGEPCTPEPNYTGMDWLCLRALPTAGTYYVRVRAAVDGDCDGTCRFNQYLLAVAYRLA
jgi:hypothetical protein